MTGEQLTKLREKHGVKKADLGRAIGLEKRPWGWVHERENGRIAISPVDETAIRAGLEKLAKMQRS